MIDIKQFFEEHELQCIEWGLRDEDSTRYAAKQLEELIQSALTLSETRNAELETRIAELEKEVEKAEAWMLEAGVIVKPSDAFQKSIDAIDNSIFKQQNK